MPTSTFYRLEKEQQNVMIQSALHEFSLYSYDKVSVFQIAKNAAIPRSTFYRYFLDKADIFEFLLNNLIGDFIQTQFGNDKNMDVFELGLQLFLFCVQKEDVAERAFLKQVITQFDIRTQNVFVSPVEKAVGHQMVTFGKEATILMTDDEKKLVIRMVLSNVVGALNAYYHDFATAEALSERLKRGLFFIKYGVVKK